MSDAFVQVPQWSGSAEGYYDGGMGPMAGSQGMPSGDPHLSIVGLLLLMILLKYLSDTNFFTFSVSEVKVSLFNLFSVGMQAIAAIILFKLLIGWLTKKGITIPGGVELAAFI